MVRKGKPKLTTGQTIDFNTFWCVYPRRQARIDAMKAWKQLEPDTETFNAIISALSWQVLQPNWSDGQFVPLPATWLRAERWHDEPVRIRREARL